MTNNEMVYGINKIKALFDTINKNYKKWFEDNSDPEDKKSEYSINGIYDSKQLGDGDKTIMSCITGAKEFLVNLSQDCVLCEKDVDNRNYKIDVQNDTNNNKFGRIKKYMWAKLICDADSRFVVSNFVGYDVTTKDKDIVHFKFYNSLDVDGANSMTKVEKDSFTALQDKIQKEESGKPAWESVVFSKDNKPCIEIKLFKDYNPNEPRDDYQALLDEYTLSIIKLKALHKYITIKDSYKEYKEEVWKKVEDLFEQMHIAKSHRIPLSYAMIEISDLIFDDCKQIVLTGAPGTGKTFSAKEYLKWQMRGRFEVGDDIKNDSEKFEKAFEKEWEKPKNKFSDQWAMVQFHPSFDYTDFVEGIRPAKVNGAKESTFVRMDGVFKQFCRKVVEKNKEKGENKPNYYFIIDEINRADLSKVFGELMFCLEENYRGSKHKIKTQYSNLDTYEMVGGFAVPVKDESKEDVFEDGFYIPENVIIIGTMNDIDRSVDTFDFALRRRFRWIKVNVDDKLLESTFRSMNKKSFLSDEQIQDYAERINNMNELFKDYPKIFRAPEDFFVGPAYFEGLFKGQSMESIWTNKVEPLLNEYIRGRDAGDFIKEAKKRFFLSKKAQKASNDKKSSSVGEPQSDEAKTDAKVEN